MAAVTCCTFAHGFTLHTSCLGRMRLDVEPAKHVMVVWRAHVIQTAVSTCHRVAVEIGETNFFRPRVSSGDRLRC